MIVDIHNHVIPAPVLDFLSQSPEYGARRVGEAWQLGPHIRVEVTKHFTDPVTKIQDLAEQGIDGAVVSAAPPLYFYDAPARAGQVLSDRTNSALADFCAASPSRLRWLAHLPLQAPHEVAAVLRRAASTGAVGAAIGTSCPGLFLDDPVLDEMWGAAEELGLPVLLHPAANFNAHNPALDSWFLQNAIGNPIDTTIAVVRMICAGVLTRHPDLRLVLVHAGGALPAILGRLANARRFRPELADAPADLWAQLAGVYFDTITYDADVLRFVVGKLGASKIVLGTDMPFDMAAPDAVSFIREAVGEDVAQQIVELNPADLFGLGPG